jgi:hypothetical protein
VCDNFASLGVDLDNLGFSAINDSVVCVIGPGSVGYSASPHLEPAGGHLQALGLPPGSANRHYTKVDQTLTLARIGTDS